MLPSQYYLPTNNNRSPPPPGPRIPIDDLTDYKKNEGRTNGGDRGVMEASIPSDWTSPRRKEISPIQARALSTVGFSVVDLLPLSWSPPSFFAIGFDFDASAKCLCPHSSLPLSSSRVATTKEYDRPSAINKDIEHLVLSWLRSNFQRKEGSRIEADLVYLLYKQELCCTHKLKPWPPCTLGQLVKQAFKDVCSRRWQQVPYFMDLTIRHRGEEIDHEVGDEDMAADNHGEPLWEK